MTEKIVLLDPSPESTIKRLREFLPPGFELSHGTTRGDEHLRDIIADADYAISGQVGVSGPVLRAAKRLKLLHKWGVGYDNLDIETARELGIKVARTTGANAIPVAEFTVGLMIATLRNIAHGHTVLREGQWRDARLPGTSLMLNGKTVGIIGFGHIGQAVAKMLSGFGCPVLYNKTRRLDPADEQRLNATFASIPDILQQSDVVSLHCPLTPQTAGMIDRAALDTMKRTAVLINVARGGVVVEADLLWALRENRIHAAAMDVYEVEPVAPDNPLLHLDNAVVTPHIASAAADNYAKSLNQMFGNILRVSRGEPIPEADLVVG